MIYVIMNKKSGQMMLRRNRGPKQIINCVINIQEKGMENKIDSENNSNTLVLDVNLKKTSNPKGAWLCLYLFSHFHVNYHFLVSLLSLYIVNMMD